MTALYCYIKRLARFVVSPRMRTIFLVGDIKVTAIVNASLSPSNRRRQKLSGETCSKTSESTVVNSAQRHLKLSRANKDSLRMGYTPKPSSTLTSLYFHTSLTKTISMPSTGSRVLISVQKAETANGTRH